MTAIGEYFFSRLGYNVYLPLLQGHGLKDPDGMEEVRLEEWKANATYAIACAASKAEAVSIGGLSTGGSLDFYMATVNPDIRGALYLFSAVLDLAGGPGGMAGEIREKLLQTVLARLIGETDALIGSFSQRFPYWRNVFAAHSACDTTSDFAAIEALRAVSFQDRLSLFRIPEELSVRHVSVVLKEPIVKDGK